MAFVGSVRVIIGGVVSPGTGGGAVERVGSSGNASAPSLVPSPSVSTLKGSVPRWTSRTVRDAVTVAVRMRTVCAGRLRAVDDAVTVGVRIQRIEAAQILVPGRQPVAILIAGEP